MFQSRRLVKPGDVYPYDLLDMGGFLLAVVPNEEESPIPVMPPVKIVDIGELQPAKARDWQGRPKFFHRATAKVCYLYFKLHELPAQVSAANPLYLVGTKRGYFWICDDLAYVTLLSEYETEEGRLPDLTFLRTGKFVMKYIDHERYKPGFVPEDDPDSWETDTEVTLHEMFGIDPTVEIPSRAQLTAAFEAAKAVYAPYLPGQIEELVNNPCTPKEAELLQRHAQHNLAKLEQGRRYFEIRIDADEANAEAARRTAAAQASLLAERFRTGKLSAPPPSAATLALGTGSATLETVKRKDISAREARHNWIDLLKAIFPDQPTLDGADLETLGAHLFSAAFASGSRLPSELDELPQIVVDIFRNAEFPAEYRWAVVRHIRTKLQGYRPEELPDELRIALEAEDIVPAEEVRALAAGSDVDSAHTQSWYNQLAARSLVAKQHRAKAAAALAITFSSDLAAAKALVPAAQEVGVGQAFATIGLPLGVRTLAGILRLINEA